MTTAMQMRAFHLPPGDAGVAKTINRMESLVSGPEGVASPFVHQTVREAIHGSVRDVTEMQAWFDWVKNAIEFRGEAEETLQSPEVTIKLRAGDCDDLSMLIAAGLRSLGYETAFRTVATQDSQGEFAHVYAVAKDKLTHKWIALDTTVEESFPGWEPPEATRERTFMAYAPGNFRPAQSIIPKQARMGRRMGFYKPGNFRGLGRLGDDSDGTAYIPLEAQALAELPGIIGVASGQAVATQTPAGYSIVGSPASLSSLTSTTASPTLWLFGAALVGGVLWVMSQR
jgi:hypothetical protein